MLVIGELINCTRKKVGAATAARDAAVIREVASRQVAAGAHVLDVNGGVPGQEVEALKWLAAVVQEVSELPLCLDSADPAALAAALPLCRHTPMISSIELARYEPILALVQEYGTQVVALAMGPSGPPSGIQDRVDNAARIIDRLAGDGVGVERIYLDPCVLPVSTGGENGIGVAEAITQVMARYPGIHTTVGLSNSSFGLPLRKLLNQTYLAVLMSRGLDSVIVDPTDRMMMAVLYASEALLGRDDYCMGYLRAFRKGLLDLPGFPPPRPAAGGGQAGPPAAAPGSAPTRPTPKQN
jgi:5-methyltetrahydrofolate--homocysteine methyltransferase